MKQPAVIAVIILLSGMIVAQEPNRPGIEVTGAYAFLRTNSVNVPAGWDASVNIPANYWFGLAGDFWGATKSESGVRVTVYAGEAGPQFTIRTPKIDPYFRFVFGAGHGSTSGEIYGFNVSGGTTAFVMSPGGGADFQVSDQFWFRLGANYPIERKYGVTLDGVQVIAGITYRFGGRHGRVESTSAKSAEIRVGDVSSPLLGVVVDHDMRVIRLWPNGVLGSHGIEVGDVINSVDNKAVKTSEEFTAAIAGLNKGAAVKIGYLSRGQWQTWMSVQL